MNRTQMQEVLRSIDPLNNTTVLADYEDYADDLRKALAAAGWTMVPMEPTEAMIRAAAFAVIFEGIPDFPDDKHGITMSCKLTPGEAADALRAGIAAAKGEV